LPEASAYAKRAEAFSVEAQTLGTTDLAHALCFRAYFARMAGDFAESRHCVEAAVARSRNGRKEILGSALRELGVLERNRPDRDLRAARKHLEEAVEIFGSIGSRVGQATCLAELAEVDHLAGDFQSALARNAEALEIEEGEGRADAVASALQRRACIAMDLGQADVVRDILVKLLPFRRERGEPGEEANCLGLLAIAEQSLGRVDVARAQLLAAVEIQERIGRTTSTVESLFALGELEAKAKHSPEARDYYERAEACYRSMGHVAAAEECQRRLEAL
jgi:tetratricopeptide (TPR) repeat protein